MNRLKRYMMKTNFIILFAILLLAGCRNTKALVDKESELDVSKKAEATNNIAIKEIVQNDISTEQYFKDSTILTETTTELSKPDSSGQQYVTRIVTRKAVKNISSIIKTNDGSISGKSLSQTGKVKIDEAINQETSEKTRVISKIRSSIYIFIVGLILIIISVFIIRRFGGIKGLYGVIVSILKNKSI